MRFVSRAGDKLDFALNEFDLDVSGLVCADLGCSTGGFTDCLLHHGATRVYAVDTGYGVLEWKLRQDPRVVVLEKTNALHIVLPEPVSLVTIDVGWTPQKLILPHAIALLSPGGHIVSLLKPHYEIQKPRLDPAQSQAIADRILSDLASLQIPVAGVIKSPILGEKAKNTEYLLLLAKPR